jgi:hypothetical protein
MKIDPRHVRFIPPSLPRPGRKQLFFVGRQNTVQALETALVFEGYLKRLSMPVVDYFFLRILSEWTTVTVPYSRILRFRHVNLWGWRLVLTALFCLPVLLLLPSAFDAYDDGASLALEVGFALLALVLSLYLNLRLLRPRFQLLFQSADGRQVFVAFRIPSRRRREEFEQLMARNRAAAAGLPRPRPVASPTSALPLVLLGAYLAAAHVIAPLWPQFLYGRPRFDLWPQMFLGLAFTEAPLFLLAVLLWRWSEVVRWVAVVLLLLHALEQAVSAWFGVGLITPRFGLPPDARIDEMGFGLTNGVALLFYLGLAALLALKKAPASGVVGEGKTAD